MIVAPFSLDVIIAKGPDSNAELSPSKLSIVENTASDDLTFIRLAFSPGRSHCLENKVRRPQVGT
jgi:hypothetical protein